MIIGWPNQPVLAIPVKVFAKVLDIHTEDAHRPKQPGELPAHPAGLLANRTRSWGLGLRE